MNPVRQTHWLIGGVLVVLIAAAAGWTAGAGEATGEDEARAARDAAYVAGYKAAFLETRGMTVNEGLKVGASRGRLAGAKTGSREGRVIGAGNAEIEQAVDSQKAADSAASAAESEIAAREPNCGVVASAPSWCPTGDELSAYREAVRAAREAAEEAEKEKDKGGAGDRP